MCNKQDTPPIEHYLAGKRAGIKASERWLEESANNMSDPSVKKLLLTLARRLGKARVWGDIDPRLTKPKYS